MGPFRAKTSFGYEKFVLICLERMLEIIVLYRKNSLKNKVLSSKTQNMLRCLFPFTIEFVSQLPPSRNTDNEDGSGILLQECDITIVCWK